MDKLGKPRPSKRRLIQLYSALLYNAHIRGFVSGKLYRGQLKNLCVPGLNCYSCPGAVAACPLGALQNALSQSSRGIPYYALGILLLFGLLLGRTVCGFLCPVGLVQELLDKLPLPKLKKSRVTRALSYLKYVILAVFAVGLSLALGYPAFCKYICPAGTLEGSLPLLANPNNSALTKLLGALYANKLVLLILFLLSFCFVYRPFCRFVCPLGAVYSLFNPVSLFGVTLDKAACVDCGKCFRVCKTDIKHAGDRECVSCMACVDQCPVNAISFRLPWKKTSKQKSPLKRLIAPLAVAVLVCLVLSVNIYPQEEATAPFALGSPCPAFSLTLDSGKVITQDDFMGRLSVINFWATWCSPCVAELPEFERLYRKYAPDVYFCAADAFTETGDAAAFWQERGYTIPLAFDDGSAIKAFGDWDALPVTVILGADGIILYNAPGVFRAGELEKLLEEHLAK
ncbi:MAG: 4Fe-4S binding protein [Clostridiales bacterium]|nr:4Fe-4S binding protein [Clostridiales bacterium]